MSPGGGEGARGGGVPCAPIMPIVDTVLCPTQGSRAPLGSLPPPPASPARAVLRLSSHTRVRPRGGAAAAVRKNIVVTSVPAVWRLLDNGVVTSGAGPQPGHLNSNVG